MKTASCRTFIASAAMAAQTMLAAAAGAAAPAGPGLGVPADAAEVARNNLDVFPDGRGLPPGGGSVSSGEGIYRAHCTACHGARGEGGSGGHLVGRDPLTGPDPVPAIGNYWPYATTLFDFIRRAMPMDAPGSLSDDEVYAVSAYLLYLNGIVGAGDTLDARTLPQVRMPNRDGFIGIDAQAP